MKPVRIPMFAPGTYPALDGTMVALTAEKLREMERNTKFAIDIGVLTPPVKYDHPVHGDKSKDAHGHATRVEVKDGVFFADFEQVSERFVKDVREGRRLRGSPEFFEKYRYVDKHGAEKFLGPTFVGFAALGADRQAIRNPHVVPLAQLSFGEGVTDVDAHYIREGLRKGGLVAQTYDADKENAFCFSEIKIDPREIEEETRMPLTAEELAQIGTVIETKINAANTLLKTDIDAKMLALKTTTDDAAKQFSEAAKTESKINQAVANFAADKKPGKSAVDNYEAALREPSFEKIKAFAESISGVFVTRGADGKEPAGDGEPKALASLRVGDFSDLAKNDARISAGLKAFAEAEPAKWSVVQRKPFAEQIDALKTHVAQRDAEAN